MGGVGRIPAYSFRHLTISDRPRLLAVATRTRRPLVATARRAADVSILIVDDDDGDIETARAILRRGGFMRVEAASDAASRRRASPPPARGARR